MSSTWHQDEIEIKVDERGYFVAEVAGATIRADTLAAVREKVLAARNANLKSAVVHTAVFVDLPTSVVLGVRSYGSAVTRGFVGTATFRGFSAKNGEALLTLPDGSKLGVQEHSTRLYHPEFPERERYVALAQKQNDLRDNLAEVGAEMDAIAARYAVTPALVTGSERHWLGISNDVARAAEASAKAIALLAERGPVAASAGGEGT